MLGPYLFALYRTMTDHCRKSCGTDQKCYNRCYLVACQKVLKKIDQEISDIGKIEKEKKRKEKIKKLNKEKIKWQKKAKKYSDRMRYEK